MLGVGGISASTDQAGGLNPATMGTAQHMTSPPIASRPETIRFGDLEIRFDDRVLHPRTWTTAQSYWASALLGDLVPGKVLELCTGAGQIGLLAISGHDRDLVAVDRDPAAGEFTLLNARAAGLEDRVEMRIGDLNEAVGEHERFALIIADPPWVRQRDVHLLPEDPVTAIDGGDDGLDIARECLDVMERHLHPEGAALLQLGSVAQAEQLLDELRARDTLHRAEMREYREQGVLLLLTWNQTRNRS